MLTPAVSDCIRACDYRRQCAPSLPDYAASLPDYAAYARGQARSSTAEAEGGSETDVPTTPTEETSTNPPAVEAILFDEASGSETDRSDEAVDPSTVHCLVCGATESPKWRCGRTLCNACGLRAAKRWPVTPPPAVHPPAGQAVTALQGPTTNSTTGMSRQQHVLREPVVSLAPFLPVSELAPPLRADPSLTVAQATLKRALEHHGLQQQTLDPNHVHALTYPPTVGAEPSVPVGPAKMPRLTTAPAIPIALAQPVPNAFDRPITASAQHFPITHTNRMYVMPQALQVGAASQTRSHCTRRVGTAHGRPRQRLTPRCSPQMPTDSALYAQTATHPRRESRFLAQSVLAQSESTSLSMRRGPPAYQPPIESFQPFSNPQKIWW